MGIAVDTIYSEVSCQIVSTGVPKLIIPVRSLEILLSIQPDLERIKQFCIDSGARGFYPFTTEVLVADSHFHARQFNPLAGIDEDPITGIAAGALGAYWNHHHNECHASYIIEQGHSMRKFGRVYVATAEDSVAISGYAMIFDKINLVKKSPTTNEFVFGEKLDRCGA